MVVWGLCGRCGGAFEPCAGLGAASCFCGSCAEEYLRLRASARADLERRAAEEARVVPCPLCDATGRLGEQECARCQGQGRYLAGPEIDLEAELRRRGWRWAIPIDVNELRLGG